MRWERKKKSLNFHPTVNFFVVKSFTKLIPNMDFSWSYSTYGMWDEFARGHLPTAAWNWAIVKSRILQYHH
jgi:hypothetical protein